VVLDVAEVLANLEAGVLLLLVRDLVLVSVEAEKALAAVFARSHAEGSSATSSLSACLWSSIDWSIDSQKHRLRDSRRVAGSAPPGWNELPHEMIRPLRSTLTLMSPSPTSRPLISWRA
jgi:hypothetical protein